MNANSIFVDYIDQRAQLCSLNNLRQMQIFSKNKFNTILIFEWYYIYYINYL